MGFNSNSIFNGASNQASSSQASFNGGKAQNVEAPVYTQDFEASNKEADLYLTPDPYGFDLFSVMYCLALPLLLYSPPHKLPVNQSIRMATLIWNIFLPPANLPPYSQSVFSSPGPVPQTQNHYCPNSPGNCGPEPAGSVLGSDCNPIEVYLGHHNAGVQQPNEQGESDQDSKKPKKAPESQITKVYPIIIDLLQQDPKFPLTHVWKQLAHHDIWVSCYKAIVEANNQASMVFHRSNDAPPQPCPTPGSSHNQVGCRQPHQQENGVKCPPKGNSSQHKSRTQEKPGCCSYKRFYNPT
ncbi:hypothetical protein DSO57_1029478 [Entomophthora muscae]|uniref:Uncharacterized protein n=1 Tax=Entomophthora muscae TaxID=34485 RepID=A0ACC2SQ79_9FUNG|nr:hypothetical protein DSO57_1029478 [Entomophthora muscae]